MRPLLLAAASTLLSACGGCQKVAATPPDSGAAAQVQPQSQSLVHHEPNTLLGGELGLDHVGIAVRDLDAAARVYTETLGFGAPQLGTLPNGLKNVNFYFADGGYIELMTCWDKGKADWLAQFLAKTEGANFVLLSVYSIDETRAFLEGRGFTLGTSQPGRIDKPGAQAGTEALWHTAFFSVPSPLPGGRVGFIGYDREHRERSLATIAKTRLARRSPHPSSAKRMQAIWMLVKDVAAAQKAYEAVGLTASGRAVEDARLGARGVELKAGQGTILLLQPTEPKGRAAQFLERRGESLAGMSIEVLSLDKASTLLSQKLGQTLAPYAGPYGKSVLVPPEKTYDVFMELFER